MKNTTTKASSIDMNDVLRDSGKPELEKQLAKSIMKGAYNKGNIVNNINNSLILKIVKEMSPIDIAKETKEYLGKDFVKELKPAEVQVILAQNIIKLCEKSKYYIRKRLINHKKENAVILIFNGKYWQKIPYGDVEQLIRAFIKFSCKNNIDYQALPYFKSLVDTLDSLVCILPPANVNKQLLNLSNWTLEFMADGTTEFNPHDYLDGLEYCLDYKYDTDATAPQWDKFIKEITSNDTSVMDVLQESASASFTNRKLEKIVILLGSGSNGKSVYLNVIQSILGHDNVSNMTLKDLTCGDKAPNNRAQLIGKKLNIANELNSKGVQDHGLIKTLASREPITVHHLYQNTFTIDKYAMLIFACNELPRDVEHNHGFFRRLLLIPFDYKIDYKDQDIELGDKLKTELSGILNWIIVGYQRLCKEKRFSQCIKSEQLLLDYKRNTDNVALFIEEKHYKPDKGVCKAFGDVMLEYKNFCNGGGYQALSAIAFSKRLKNVGFNVKKDNGTFVYLKYSA